MLDIRPYEGVDICEPYNISAQRTGAMNEWRDKKYEWDELIVTLNTRVFGNKDWLQN